MKAGGAITPGSRRWDRPARRSRRSLTRVHLSLQGSCVKKEVDSENQESALRAGGTEV